MRVEMSEDVMKSCHTVVRALHALEACWKAVKKLVLLAIEGIFNARKCMRCLQDVKVLVC